MWGIYTHCKQLSSKTCSVAVAIILSVRKEGRTPDSQHVLNLHRFCLGCKRRGHRSSDHQKHSILSLEMIFRAWACAGKLTSLPILSADSGHWRKVEPEEHRFSVFNVSGKVGLDRKYGITKPLTAPPKKPRFSRQDHRDHERRQSRARAPAATITSGQYAREQRGRSRSPRPSTSRAAQEYELEEAQRIESRSERFAINPMWRECHARSSSKPGTRYEKPRK